MSKLISIRLSEEMINEAIEGLKHQKDLVAFVMTTPLKKRDFDKLITRYGRIIATISLLQQKKHRVCASNPTNNTVESELHLKRNPVNLQLEVYESN